jgi:hypothetical protein
VIVNEHTLVPADPLLATVPLPSATDRHPAHVYLARLGAGSRRTMGEALNTIARILTNGRADFETLPWPALRYQHTAAIRAALMEKYKPSTTNKTLAALLRILPQTDHPFSSETDHPISPETDQCSPVKAISVLR